ncbi:coiled-coil domain-containing protein 137-like [Montipora capricornis]|uniref:coiled-coil domain-containing protein 137-like n=1 Tax=Montipora capricornis TaxID=246305 RepID=UPI0035F1F9A5
MGRISRYKKIKSCDPFYKGPRKDRNASCDIPLSKNDKLIEQEMPRAAKDLLRRQQELQYKTTKKKRRRKEKKQVTTAKFQQIPGETKKEYFDRIDREAAVEVAESFKKSRKIREGRKRFLDKRKQKMKGKKSFVENSDFDFMKDNVRFGEVAMEPPSLSAKPRKASNLTSKGSKTLLLHSLINRERKANSVVDAQTTNSAVSSVPKTKKRKHMSTLEREKADKAREGAIMAYRTMRKKQLQERKGAV